MTGIVESIKSAVGDTTKNFGKRNLRDTMTSVRKGSKSVVSEAQAADPGSKYIGTSIMPGVKSEKEIAKDKKVTRTAEAENAAAIAADKNKPTPMPSIAAEDLAAKRRAARRGGGRISTVLSDTLG